MANRWQPIDNRKAASARISKTMHSANILTIFFLLFTWISQNICEGEFLIGSMNFPSWFNIDIRANRFL